MNVRLSTLFTFSLCSLALAAPAKKTSAPQRTAPAAAPIKKVIPFKEGLFSTETRSSGPVREAKFLYFKVDTLPEAETINFMTEECNKDLPLYETTRSHDFAQRSIIPPVKTLIQIVNDAAKELATGKVDSVTKTVKFALKDKSESVVVTFEFKKNNSKDPKTNAGMSVVITLKGTRSAIPTRTVNLLKATTLDNTFLQTWGKVLGFSSAGTLGTAAVVGALWSRRSTKPNDKPKPDFSTHFKTKEERDTAFAAHVKALKALLAKVGVSIATVESLTQKLKDADREDTKILAELPTQQSQLTADLAQLTKCFEDAKDTYGSYPDPKKLAARETPTYPTDVDQNAVGRCESRAKAALQAATQAMEAFKVAAAKQAEEKEAAAIAKADAHYQRKLKEKMFGAVGNDAKIQQAAKQQADALYQRKLKEKVVGALHEHAQNQSQERAARALATQTAKRNLLRTGFRGLAQNVTNARKNRLAPVHYNRRLAGNVLTKWSEWTKSEQGLRHRLRKMFSNWDARTLTSSFADWKESTLESKAAQRKAQCELAHNFAQAIGIERLKQWKKPQETVKGLTAYFDTDATAHAIGCPEVLYEKNPNAVFFLTAKQFGEIYKTTTWDGQFAPQGIFVILDPMNESEPTLEGKLPKKLIWITARKAYFQNDGSLCSVEVPTRTAEAEERKDGDYVASNLHCAYIAWRTYFPDAGHPPVDEDDEAASDDGDDHEVDEEATKQGVAVVYRVSAKGSAVDSGHGTGVHDISKGSAHRRTETLSGAGDDDDLARLIETPDETANLKLQSIKEYLEANLTGIKEITLITQLSMLHIFTTTDSSICGQLMTDEISLIKFQGVVNVPWNDGSTTPITIEANESAEETILKLCIDEFGLSRKEPARA